MPVNSRALIELDLQNQPLGMGPNDPHFGTPFGGNIAPARVFLRNHSAKQKRKYVKVPVSWRRGAAAALSASDKATRDMYNVATYVEAIKEGQDMNVYAEKIERVLFAPMFNGKRYPIPPAKGDEEPPLIQVPDGLWDLLCGNYTRMNAVDPRVREAEMARFALSQVRKHSPILFVTVDGQRTMKDNPFGFIEIERRTERMEPIAPDTEFLTALELVEA